MQLNKSYEWRRSVCAVAFCGGALMAGFAQAQGVPIEDDELADVWGQAMFSVENRDGAGTPAFDYTRITLNADIRLNANFYNIDLGRIADSSSIASDVNIGELRFVSGAGAENYVSIKDPYLEFVYKNQNTADKEIIGMRFGFGELSGKMGTLFNNLKGNIKFTDGASTGAGDLTLNASAGRAAVFQCANATSAACSGGVVNMNMVGEVHAGVDGDKSTDFFISMLTEAVSDFGDGKNRSAPQGISINWQNNVKYMNLTGTMLANPLPSLSVRQGG